MSTKKKLAGDEVESPAPAITLNDFCIRLSEVEKRVELISGFNADERRNGRTKDSAEAFSARFSAFVSRPA